MSHPALVSIAKGGTPYQLVRRALGLVDGEERVRRARRVVVKPNLVRVPADSPYAHVKGAYTKGPGEGDIVHREVMEALLKALQEWGVRDVTIAEASGGCETTVAYRALALYELADEYGTELLDLNYADSVKVPVHRGLILDHVWVPSLLREADLRVNLTTLKVYGFTAVTFCLKNWGIGILPGKYDGFDKTAYFFRGLDEPLPIHQRGDGLKVLGQEVAVSKVIADVCSAQGYDLGIIDGLTALHYPSLTPGAKSWSAEETNMVIAGNDMVAVDATALRLVSLDPEKVLHIKYSRDKGLGTLDPSEIEVRGEPLEEARVRCNPLYEQRELVTA